MKNKKEIYVYKVNGKFVAKFDSVATASKKLKLFGNNVSCCALDKIR